MATYTQIIYHLVFATKLREPALTKSRRDDLYRFMWGMLNQRQCHMFRIGGVEDHVHILTSLHPTIALSNLVKELKTASSVWIKGEHVFPQFTHWQEDYGAFTHALPDKARLIDYIKNQEQHHKALTFREEYEALLLDAGLKPDERDELWFDD
ncbi:MAG: IS200/IS605 family transposase [Verrucomicrobiaceae bacterium]|nr:IS200/IS605 family transposase [Verrucomicrobiaceae bacterium]